MERNNNSTQENIMKKNIIAIIIFIIIAIITMVSGFSGGGSKSKWDSLTTKEKQYYQDSYGNGKSKEYTKAIDNYKKSKGSY